MNRREFLKALGITAAAASLPDISVPQLETIAPEIEFEPKDILTFPNFGLLRSIQSIQEYERVELTCWNTRSRDHAVGIKHNVLAEYLYDPKTCTPPVASKVIPMEFVMPGGNHDLLKIAGNFLIQSCHFQADNSNQLILTLNFVATGPITIG